MPCFDGSPPSQEEILDKLAPAMLCGIVRAATNQMLLGMILEDVDWAEIGVTRLQFEAWWRLHMKKDEARRKREAEAAEKAKLAKQARAKLSKAELKALGLK